MAVTNNIVLIDVSYVVPLVEISQRNYAFRRIQSFKNDCSLKANIKCGGKISTLLGITNLSNGIYGRSIADN